MDDLSFANPEMLWFAAPVIALTLWGAVQLSSLPKRLAKLGTGPIVAQLTGSYSPRAETWRLVCLALAMLLLVGAATRPRYGLRETEVSNAGIDIAFAVDASKSMLVRDVAPNRIQGTAIEISSLLDRLAGGRVALVPFAGIPFVQTPLTTDHDVLRTYMSELRPQDMPMGGTNIGRAIKVATEVLTGSDEKAMAQVRGNLMSQFSGSKHKAIVLFSDGEDHQGAALDEAKKAAKKGIRIFTVGVGSGFGDPVPVVGNDGLITGTLKDASGNPIFSKLNTKLLEAIATATGGKYFHYANTSVAKELFTAVDSLEKAEHRERFKLLGEDRFQYLLGPALLLLFAVLLIPRRKSLVARKGPETNTKQKANMAKKAPKARQAAVFALAALMGGALVTPPAYAQNPARPDTPAEAAENAAEKAAEHAGDAPVAKIPDVQTRAAPARSTKRTQAEARRDPHWLERENPDIADGRERLSTGKAGEALAAFKEAQANRPEHAVIWYNVALAQASLKMHEEAEKSFVRSLASLAEHDPELEADLYFGWGTMQLGWGLSVLENAANEAQVNAKAPGGGGAGGSQPAPDPGPGGAPTAPGTKPSPGAGAAGSQQKAETEAAKHFRAAVDQLQKAFVAAPTRAAIARNLEIARLYAYPPCRSRDKNHEPNDQAEMAQSLKLETDKKETTVALRSCPADNDFFKLDLQPGDRLTVSVETKAAESLAIDPLDQETGREAQLGIALLSADGKRWLRGAPPPAEALTTVDLNRVVEPETVLIAVRNVAEVETPYDLKLKLLPACSRIEDKAEPNDTPEQARQMPIGKPVQLRLCPRNDDYFGVPMQIGQGLMLQVEATFDTGVEELEIDILAPDGTRLARARKGEKGYVARLAAAPSPGNYLIRVRGGLETEADYKLAAQLLPPCRARDDAWEDNDQALAANPLTPDELKQPLEGLQLCPGDDDWFVVELKEGESLFADLMGSIEGLPDVAPLAGALTMTVYDEQGRVWRRARGGQLADDAKAISRVAAVLSPPPGKYFVRVTGGGVAAPTFPLPDLPEDAKVVEVTAPPPGKPGQPNMPMMGQPPMVKRAPGQQNPPGPSQPGAPQGGIRGVPLPGAQPGGFGAPQQGRQPGQGGQPGQAGQPGGGQQKPERKIRKVVLPPGFPAPEVDARRTKLDLPYSLKLRILPPCPEGNDELEPNDEAGAAKEVKVKQERLLRICKGDVDWLQITQKAGQQLQAMARYDLAHGPLDIKVYDEGGATMIAEGKVAAPRLPGGRLNDDSPEARRGRTATTGVGIPAPEKDRVLKLRVSAKTPQAENFYVLRIQEPPPPSDKNKQNKPNKDKKDNKDDKKKDKKDKKQQPKKQKKKDNEQRRKERLRKQMKRHDRNPRNLEAQEALRRSPFRNQRPEKDW